MNHDTLQFSYGGLFGLACGIGLGVNIGLPIGYNRARRDLQAIIDRLSKQEPPRPLSLTITQPPGSPGTIHVTETPSAAPAIESGEPFVLDHAEVERRKMEDAEEFMVRTGAVLGTGGYAPGTLPPSPASIVVVSPDPLVQNLVIGPALGTE